MTRHARLALLLAISLAPIAPGLAAAKDGKPPAIEGKTYDAARAALLASGWTPRENPAAHGESAEVQSGNGPLFWSRGYRELQSCSGTGMAFCRFEFIGADRSVLVVITSGEEDEGGATKATVSSVSFDK